MYMTFHSFSKLFFIGPLKIGWIDTAYFIFNFCCKDSKWIVPLFDQVRCILAWIDSTELAIASHNGWHTVSWVVAKAIFLNFCSIEHSYTISCDLCKHIFPPFCLKRLDRITNSTHVHSLIVIWLIEISVSSLSFPILYILVGKQV